MEKGPGKEGYSKRPRRLFVALLEIDVSDARGALINVVGGNDLTLGEAEQCAKIIRDRINPHERIIWGATSEADGHDGYVRTCGSNRRSKRADSWSKNEV